MAELIGFAASSIAIVETASKVAGAVLALKELWDEIQNVPDMIRNLMTEIEVLEPILTVIEDDFKNTGSPLPNDRASQLALAYCRKAVKDLDEIVKHLSMNLQAARRTRRGKAKVRVILEKDTLTRLQDRMQAAVRLLTLAQQTYLVALTKSQPEIIFRRLESSAMTSSRSSIEPLYEDDGDFVVLHNEENAPFIRSRQFEACSSFSYIGNLRTAFGNISWGRGTEDENTLFGWMTRFEAPAWLSQSAWDLRITHSTSGWRMNLKPYCVRSHEDRVFLYAIQGDTQALGELIRSGQASIYDTDDCGWSLLHYACFNSRVGTVQQLLLWGAEMTMATNDKCLSPAHCAIAGMTYGGHRLQAWPELDHLLTSIGAYEENEDVKPWKPGSHEGIKGDDEFIENQMSFSVEHFDFFQPVFSPNHYELDICERLDYGRVQWFYHDDVLRYLLFNDATVTTEEIATLEQRGIGPLNLVAYGYQSYDSLYGEETGLRTLVHDMIKSGANLHFEQQPHALPPHMRGDEGYPFSTPFFGALIPHWKPIWRGGMYFDRVHCSQDLQWQIKSAMLRWLRALHECGIDLERYGKTEKKVFRKNKILKERWYPCAQWMQLSEFKYGPEPEDWMLEWDLMPERFVGEFWAMVEDQLHNPELPGGWVDSLLDDQCGGVGYYDPCGSSETLQPGAGGVEFEYI